MQTHELLKQLRVPELAEVRDYIRSLSTNTLIGMGAFTAVTAYWFATRPKALKAPCDLRMQSLELPVSTNRGQITDIIFVLSFGRSVFLFTGWGICSAGGHFKRRRAFEPLLRRCQDLVRVLPEGHEGVRYVLFGFISSMTNKDSCVSECDVRQ